MLVGFVGNGNFELLREGLSKAIPAGSLMRGLGEGTFLSRKMGVGLGGNRCVEQEGVVVAYDGRINNLLPMKRILENYGYLFSNSDITSEVILRAYLRWGAGSFGRFTGAFVFVIWDGPKGKLFLIRDQLGAKPIYYYFHNGALIFASELGAITLFKGFPKDLDLDSIPLFLHYQYVPAPKTIYKNTCKLLPGHFLIYRRNTQSLHLYPYWQHLRNGMIEVSEKEGLVRLNGLLNETISNTLSSAPFPVGVWLSGGVDSSLIAAMVQRLRGSHSIYTFTAGFEEGGYDETRYALEVANCLGIEHIKFYVTAEEAISMIMDLPEIYDEPFADSSAIATVLLAKLTSKYVKLVLTGEGGDELYCGYDRYWGTQAIVSTLQYFPVAVRKILFSCLKIVPSKCAASFYSSLCQFLPQKLVVDNFVDKWEKLINLILAEGIENVYEAIVGIWSRQELLSLLGKEIPSVELFETVGQSFLSRLMCADLKALADGGLFKVGRAGVFNSLEVVMPLLDSRVVEYSLGLPDSLKYRDGVNKYLLRKLLFCYDVPSKFFERPKKGFAVPVGRWFCGSLRPLLLDYLSSDRLRKEGLFDVKLVEEKVNEHLTGHVNNQHKLWALLMWEMWREKWL